MSTYSQSIIGLVAFQLSQRRYKDGHLYLSAVFSGKNLTAIDIRYFVEDEDNLIPTYCGFRINVTHLPKFLEVVKCLPENINNEVISESNSRKLVVNYKDDSFGKGVDFRYYKMTPSFTGWEKRGIRFSIPDFEKLRKSISDLKLNEVSIDSVDDLFADKRILTKDEVSKNTSTKTAKSNSVGYINEAVKDILDEN